MALLFYFGVRYFALSTVDTVARTAGTAWSLWLNFYLAVTYSLQTRGSQDSGGGVPVGTSVYY